MIIDLNSSQFKKAIDRPQDECDSKTHDYVFDFVISHPENFIPQGVMSGIDLADYDYVVTSNDAVSCSITIDCGDWKWDSNDMITWVQNEPES